MRDGAIARGVLDGMCESVSVVETLSHTGGLGAVLAHHGCLELGGHVDRLLKQLDVMCHETRGVVTQPFVEGTTRGHEGALGYLGKAVCPVLLEKGLEASDVRTHEDGLMEGADEVLAGLKVDPRLAANGRVDHRKQGRGHLDEVDAAHVGRGDEAGQIAHDATAARNDEIIASETIAGDSLPELIGEFDGLGGFPRRDEQVVDLESASSRRFFTSLP